MKPKLTEQQSSVLQEARYEIAGTVGGIFFELALKEYDGTPLQDNTQIWNQLTTEFFPFSDKIRQIKQTIDNGLDIIDGYPKEIANVLAYMTSRVTDRYASEFLKLIAVVRTVGTNNDFVNMRNVPYELNEMLGELEIKRECMSELTLESMVEKALTGELRLTSEVPQEQIQDDF